MSLHFLRVPSGVPCPRHWRFSTGPSPAASILSSQGHGDGAARPAGVCTSAECWLSQQVSAASPTSSSRPGLPSPTARQASSTPSVKTVPHSSRAALDGHSHFLPQSPHLQSGLSKADVMGRWRYQDSKPAVLKRTLLSECLYTLQAEQSKQLLFLCITSTDIYCILKPKNVK